MQLETTRRIKEFILQNFVYWGGANALSETDSLLAKGIIDSAGILELITFLEMEFGITIEDEDVVPANLDSIVLASAFVERKLGAVQPNSEPILASAAG